MHHRLHPNTIRFINNTLATSATSIMVTMVSTNGKKLTGSPSTTRSKAAIHETELAQLEEQSKKKMAAAAARKKKEEDKKKR